MSSPLNAGDIGQLKIGYATPCLGMHENHTLELKFEALMRAGFKYVELGLGNYMAWVRSKVDLPPSTCPKEWMSDDEPDPSDDTIWDALYSHTSTIKELARRFNLELLIFQVLNQFDGWPQGEERGEWSRRKAEKWLKLCSMLGVKYLQFGWNNWIRLLSQVGANDQAGEGAGDDKSAEDMRWLAELGAKQENPVAIAYEPWCFSPRVSDWEHCYEIIKKADHPNVGLCLDTAQMALAPAYGFDPTTGEGFRPEQVDALIERIHNLDPAKIFFFEICDVQLPDPPLGKGSPYDDWAKAQPEGTPQRSNWVLCGRSIPYIGRKLGKDVHSEKDMGAARVIDLARAVFATGFRGPVIWEVFEATEMEKADETIPMEYAEASRISKEKLFAELTSESG